MTANQYGLVWLNGKQIYFKDFRHIRSHKGMKRIAVQIRGKEYKVNVEAVKRWPKTE